MSGETERWQRQLELATSCRAAADEVGDPAAGDPETGDLRDGWTALVRLLENADADWDEQALPVRVQAGPPSRSRAVRWGVSALLAASLLAAASAAWFGLRNHQGQELPVAESGVASASTGSVAANSVAAQATDVPSAGDLRWDDAWEEQLSQLDESLTAFDSWSNLSDAAFQIVDVELEQISQEMTAEL